jgi:tripeptidyl-peptidase I
MNVLLLIAFCCFSPTLASVRPTNNGWSSLGKAGNFNEIDYTLHLPQENVDKLVQFVVDAHTPHHDNYGQSMTPEEIRTMLAPPYMFSEFVKQTLSKHNVLNIEDRGDSFRCRDAVLNINRMYNVTMFVYENKETGARVIRSTTDYVLPFELTGTDVFIDGLSNKLLPAMKPTKSKQSAVADPGFVSREVIMSLYNISNGVVKDPNTSLSAIEFQGGGYSVNGQQNSQTDNGLKPRSLYKAIGPNPGGGIETMLDLQVEVTVAGEAQLWVANYDQWILEFAEDMMNRDEIPSVMSLSYGWAEWDQCYVINCNTTTSQKYIDRVNTALFKLAARRVTVVVASGDAGTPGRTSEGCDSTKPCNPVYPGSSPAVLSVGGTYLAPETRSVEWKTTFCKKNKCATGRTHVPVNFDAVEWTTGAGFGIYSSETTPAWQQSAVSEYLRSGVDLPNQKNWNANGRGYPDIVANGHNCPVNDINQMGSYSPVDGTSCSTPLLASIIALLNDHQTMHGRPLLGLVGPLLYNAARDGVTFGDVQPGNTSCTEDECCGSDFGFQTPPGRTLWNPVSGLGTPNVGALIEYLDSLKYNI